LFDAKSYAMVGNWPYPAASTPRHAPPVPPSS
ncbi:hypothetical protein GNI_182790, partial [Gregarina niphandrodes]